MYGQASVFCTLNILSFALLINTAETLYCILKFEGGFLKPWKLPPYALLNVSLYTSCKQHNWILLWAVKTLVKFCLFLKIKVAAI